MSNQFLAQASKNRKICFLCFWLVCNWYPFKQIQVMKDDNDAHKGSPFLTSTRGRTPPLVTSNFVVQDDGMSSGLVMTFRNNMWTVDVVRWSTLDLKPSDHILLLSVTWFDLLSLWFNTFVILVNRWLFCVSQAGSLVSFCFNDPWKSLYAKGLGKHFVLFYVKTTCLHAQASFWTSLIGLP